MEENNFEANPGSPLFASLLEGEQWIAKLEEEQSLLEMDVLIASESLSQIGVASLVFSLQKTKDAIEQIKLEMMMLDG